LGVGFVVTTAFEGSGGRNINPRTHDINALMISFMVAV
jgi:hypothetical protein